MLSSILSSVLIQTLPGSFQILTVYPGLGYNLDAFPCDDVGILCSFAQPFTVHLLIAAHWTGVLAFLKLGRVVLSTIFMTKALFGSYLPEPNCL